MVADKALLCDCGHEVRGSGEPGLVAAIQRHAWEAHRIEFPVALAQDLARGAYPAPPMREPNGDRTKETR